MSVSDKWSVRCELENERISQTWGHKSFLSSELITIMDTPLRDSQGREKTLYMAITFILFSGVKQHRKLERVSLQTTPGTYFVQFYLSDTCIVIYTFYLLHGNIIKTCDLGLIILIFPVAYSHSIRNSDHNQILNHRRNGVIQRLVIMLRQFKYFFIERMF